MSAESQPQGCMRTLLFGVGLLAVGIVLILLLTWELLGPGMRPPLTPAGPGGPGPGQPVVPVGVRIPPISQRYFDSGSSTAGVTGAMAYTGTLPIDTVRSYVDDEGLAWIGFGALTGGPEVLVTFNEPEDSVTIVVGAMRATGMDDQCAFDIEVSDTLVAGHISCPSVDAYDGEQVVGTSGIELDFSAGSPPGGGLETDTPE